MNADEKSERQARFLVSRSDGVSLAQPFKAGISCEIYDLVASATIESSSSGVHMANTYTSLHYHVIFSTKNREPWITPDIEARVWRFVGGIARKHAMTALQIGGVEDHLHTLVTAPPILAPSQIAQILKGESSKWIHGEFHGLKGFSWQDGYGAFSVSKSNIPAVISYIENQREHHRRKNVPGGIFGILTSEWCRIR